MSDFVGFDLAKKLKEKGFREECLRYYDTKDGDKDYFYWNGNEAAIANALYHSWNTNNEGFKHPRFDAPTISQVLKWLREKHNILVSPSVYGNEDGRKWNYAIVDIETFELLNPVLTSNLASFEEAAVAGIERVLDNLI